MQHRGLPILVAAPWSVRVCGPQLNAEGFAALHPKVIGADQVDYHGETPEGEQLPVLNVFSRDEDGIHHRWASELTFAPGGDTSSLDPIWPIWGALDMTPEGRGDGAGYPSLQYE